MANHSPARKQARTQRAPRISGTVINSVSDSAVIIPKKGLQFRQRLPFENWLTIGKQLSDIYTSSAWCLGDWLLYGQAAYAGRYRNAIELTSLDYQTLRNYAWVANRFTLSRRRDTLSFGHHAEVAALSEPEQEFWLRKAEDLAWSVKQLRREVRASLRERSDTGGKELGKAPEIGEYHENKLHLEIDLTPDQMQTCWSAAAEFGLSVEAWTVLALEHAIHCHAIRKVGSASTSSVDAGSTSSTAGEKRTGRETGTQELHCGLA